MPTIKIPYDWEPNEYQLNVLRCPARYRVLVWHRRARKTSLAINELIRWCYAKRGVYAYVAPYRDQAKKIVWDGPDMLQKYCPPEEWRARNNSELKLTFPNGSILYVMGGDNPDNLRGLDMSGIIFDEYGDMKSDVWTVVKPILAANGGWAWFVGTPKGENDFKAKFDYARTSGDSDWAAFFLPAEKSGIITPEALDESRRTMPQAMYEQEFECLFMSGASQYFRYVDEAVRPTVDFNQTHIYQLGVDLAKMQDWTVITPFDLTNFAVLPQDRFNHVEWAIQKSRIEASYWRYKAPRTVLDSTGVGDPIVEDLERICDNVEGFKFTETSRRQLLDHLAVMFENRKLTIPDDEGLKTELKSFRWELGNRGKLKVKVPDGMTDDRVMSLALATWGCPDSPEKPERRLPTELERDRSIELDVPFHYD